MGSHLGSLSWCLLTFNRPQTVIECAQKTFSQDGHLIDEFLLCDNNSELNNYVQMIDGLPRQPDVIFKNRENYGVARGYNAMYRHTRADFIMINDGDKISPPGWIEKSLKLFEKRPDVMIISVEHEPLEKIKERWRSEVFNLEGHDVKILIPMGIRIFRRRFLDYCGYDPEQFGLARWEDVAWAYTIERVCREKNWLPISFVSDIATHCQLDETQEYIEFKTRATHDQQSLANLDAHYKAGCPKFDPWS